MEVLPERRPSANKTYKRRALFQITKVRLPTLGYNTCICILHVDARLIPSTRHPPPHPVHCGQYTRTPLHRHPPFWTHGFDSFSQSIDGFANFNTCILTIKCAYLLKHTTQFSIIFIVDIKVPIHIFIVVGLLFLNNIIVIFKTFKTFF